MSSACPPGVRADERACFVAVTGVYEPYAVQLTRVDGLSPSLRRIPGLRVLDFALSSRLVNDRLRSTAMAQLGRLGRRDGRLSPPSLRHRLPNRH